MVEEIYYAVLGKK